MLKLLFLILHSSFFNPFALLSNVVQKGILSQKHFPIGNFPRVFSECAISQAATSKRLGPLQRRRLRFGHSAGARMGQEVKRHGQNKLGAKRCGFDILGKLPLRKLRIWEFATWENTPPPSPTHTFHRFYSYCSCLI